MNTHTKIKDEKAIEQAGRVFEIIRQSCNQMSEFDQGAFLAEVVMMAATGIMAKSDAQTASEILDQTAITLINISRKKEPTK